MISTATAAVNANVAVSPVPSQKPSVATASTITTGTNTPEMRSASRCTGAFPLCASSTSRAICASAVSAPTRVARTTSRPPALTVAPATSSPGPTSTGTDSPVSMLMSTAERALLDDAVGGELLARPHDEAVARPRAARPARAVPRRPAPSTRDVLRPEREQRLQRGPARGAWPAPRSSGRRAGRWSRCPRSRGRSGPRPRRRPGRARTTSACRSPPRRRGTARRRDHSQAASVPRLISVSIVAAPWRRFAHAARWNGQPPHSDDRRDELQREPLPVVELQRRDHRHQQHRHRQHGGDDQPQPQRGGLVRLGGGGRSARGSATGSAVR